MKFYSSILVTLFTILVFSPLNIFACACCADEGYYRISVQAPGSFQLGELKRLKFQNGKIYSTAGFPDDIKGLAPIGEEYAVEASVSAAGWDFAFTDSNGKTGTLSLKMPKNFVDYAVDTRNGEKGGAGSVMLYKEWRFKYRVKTGTGMFADGIKGKTEYFLVFQGKGNVCNSADDFANWRLEVTGKNASYAFYGGLSTEEPTTAATPARTETETVKSGKRTSSKFINVSNLVGANYQGCGCSGWSLADKNAREQRKPIFWSEFKPDSDTETLFMNINGKDTELKLLSKGERPENEKVGDKYSDEYLAQEGLKVIIDYTTKKLPCEECEGTDYDVTATVIGEFAGKVMNLSGSCGC